jgi:hypothetical protein
VTVTLMGGGVVDTWMDDDDDEKKFIPVQGESL